MTFLEFLDCESVLKARFDGWRVARGTEDVSPGVVDFTLYRQDKNEVFVRMDVEKKEIIEARGRVYE